ncbi:hypothetical protein F0562_013474 [Nyssa sinensis]|uniref:Uncharacterized protein n=1 Tax=Nyssa sinensis TaxID=561372 RepID=A0A5J4ZNI9_9ASTE|nr:hypothetical protein F0562_013474 [Nyssa sinensis]
MEEATAVDDGARTGGAHAEGRAYVMGGAFGQVGLEGLIPISVHEGGEEIKFLHGIFTDLMVKQDQCLLKMGSWVDAAKDDHESREEKRKDVQDEKCYRKKEISD